MQTRSIVTLSVLALSGSMMAQQTITCSSSRSRSHFCPANTQNGVMLIQEHSDGVCEQGSTWTYTKRGITVNGGCSADFQVGRQGSAGANNSNSYGNDSYGNNSSDANRNNDNNSHGNNSSDANRNGQYHTDGNGQNSANRDGYPNNNQSGQQRDDADTRRDRRQGAMVIPAGTQLDVRIEQRVSASEVTQGEVIPATLVNGVSVNGQLVASAGTPVRAKVVSAQGAPLDVRLDSITINGQRYMLVSNSIHGSRDSQSGQNEGGQTAGQEIGSLLGTLTGGAQLPRGSVYSFRLTSAARAMPIQ